MKNGYQEIKQGGIGQDNLTKITCILEQVHLPNLLIHVLLRVLIRNDLSNKYFFSWKQR